MGAGPQILTRAAGYDVVVVGSGATGGVAARELTSRGLTVAVLEAGPDLAALAAQPGDYERKPVQRLHPSCDRENHRYFVDDLDNPYTTPEGRPFTWVRGRQIGGRTLRWKRQVYRIGEEDLRAPERLGYDQRWPIHYADLEPHYRHLEALLGVAGEADALPYLPTCELRERYPLSPAEAVLRERLERAFPGCTAIRTRRLTTRPPPGMEVPDGAPLGYASSAGSTLRAAAATGRLTLIPDAVARQVMVDPRTGEASGVAYVDRRTRTAREARAKAVVLCASTIESCRLLLASAPGGLANSSGRLGRYLMDHLYGVRVEGLAPDYPVCPRADQLMVPAFAVRAGRRGFLGDYQVKIGVSTEGKVRKFAMVAFGEMLPRPENRVTLEPAVEDAWGVPAARIECAHSDNERRMAEDMLQGMREIARAAGLEETTGCAEPSPPGMAIHEVGGAPMGSDPRTSVLDPFNRAWDVPNLLVTDGACFPSAPYHNPTLTMMAITARACHHLAERMRRA